MLRAVTWPPSSGLLVSEVVTGAGSASDEFVEIYNASTVDQELGGLELVYVTSSGSTVSRKQTWTQLTLGAHRHLLLANSAGKWASGADGLYSSGFAATGGSVALRTLGGTVIDSLSWGDAASSFVEGAAGPAPAAGSSLERRPGGAAGNATDTNDNLADTRLESDPQPQSMAAEAVPATHARANGLTDAHSDIDAAPNDQPRLRQPATDTDVNSFADSRRRPHSDSHAHGVANADADANSNAHANSDSHSDSDPDADPDADSDPHANSNSNANSNSDPTPTPSVPPTATPAPTPSPIADRRSATAGRRSSSARARSRDRRPGLDPRESTVAIQDESAGIYVRLIEPDIELIVPGRVLQVDGVLADPFGNLELRPEAADVEILDMAAIPPARTLSMADLNESTEGILATVIGTISSVDAEQHGHRHDHDRGPYRRGTDLWPRSAGA